MNEMEGGEGEVCGKYLLSDNYSINYKCFLKTLKDFSLLKIIKYKGNKLAL